MTRVRIDKSGLGRDIYITGHCANENSGSAEATLVCAAMTTLAQTIAQNVFDSEDTGDTDIIDVTLRSGQAVISLSLIHIYSFKGYYSVFCVLKNVHDCENEEKIRKTEGIYVQMLKMRRNV